MLPEFGCITPEARLSLQTVLMYFSVQAVPVFSGFSLQTGWFVESDAEASWWLSKKPVRDFQSFGRACDDPSWFCTGMGLTALWSLVFQADLL